jgi:hypothetical protein
VLSISLRGERVSVSAEPSIEWRFGDGAALVGGAGRPYAPGPPPAGAIRHLYETRCLPGDVGRNPAQQTLHRQSARLLLEAVAGLREPHCRQRDGRLRQRAPQTSSLADRHVIRGGRRRSADHPHGICVIGERAAPAKRPENTETLGPGQPNPALHPTRLVAFALSRSGGDARSSCGDLTLRGTRRSQAARGVGGAARPSRSCRRTGCATVRRR